MSLLFDVVIIFILFTLFGISHTILASTKVKHSIALKLGDKVAFYRLFYNITSLISFFIVLDISPKPDIVLYDLPNPWDIVFLVIQILGLAGFIWCFHITDGWEFLGVKQVLRFMNGTYKTEEVDEHSELIIEGPYKFSRHPIYFFSVVVLAFRPAMSFWYLVLLVCVVIYFIIGTYYEEKKLVKLFDVRYIEYQKNVPRIFPYKFSSKNY